MSEEKEYRKGWREGDSREVESETGAEVGGREKKMLERLDGQGEILVFFWYQGFCKRNLTFSFLSFFLLFSLSQVQHNVMGQVLFFLFKFAPFFPPSPTDEPSSAQGRKKEKRTTKRPGRENHVRARQSID